VITAHVMGIPVEESILQLMPAGAVMAAAAGIAVRSTLDRGRRRRRRDAGAGRS
jgi:branched-subunit amino acid ABC-type transport system permease component